jgi:hypothetical protein
MTEHPAGRANRSGDPAARLGLVALTAVIVGVLLLAAAAFLLSYSGIHHIALQAGVSPKLARFYPGIFDAMLVIASAAVLALRSAGWLTRVYVWLCLLALLAAVATGDAVHAMGVALPRQPSRAGVAITPWALVLLSFGLLLAMLRHARRSRPGGRGQARPQAQAGPDTQASQGLGPLLEPRQGEPPALPAAEHVPPAGADQPGPEANAAAAPPATGGHHGLGGYFAPEGSDGTDDAVGPEDYGGVDVEEYSGEYLVEEPGQGTRYGSTGSRYGSTGPWPGTQGGEGEDTGSSAPGMPASAPLPPFDRMHSSPTHPDE